MIMLIGLVSSFLLGLAIGVYITIDKYQSLLNNVRRELNSIKVDLIEANK